MLIYAARKQHGTVAINFREPVCRERERERERETIEEYLGISAPRKFTVSGRAVYIKMHPAGNRSKLRYVHRCCLFSCATNIATSFRVERPDRIVDISRDLRID